MTKPILNAPRVVASIGQGVAAGMPQHVSVDLKGEATARANALDQPVDGTGGDRKAWRSSAI